MTEELSEKQKALAAIRKADKIVIFSHQHPDGDSIGSSLALGAVLRKIDKSVSLVCSDPVPDSFQFLSDVSLIKNKFEGSKDFIISLAEREARVDKLSYKLEKGQLKIVVSPEKGNFIPKDVSFSWGDYHYDLIIILDTGDTTMLGSLYNENAEMFYKSRTLNIDHHSSNTFFAEINLVEEKASSTAEVLVSLIEALEGEMEKKLIDEDVATALLLGVMTDTNLFQNQNVSSKTLTVAAQLTAAGGRREEIVNQIFRSKPLSTLKIWGVVLSQMRLDKEHKFIWSKISLSEIEKAGASPEALTGAINDLLSNANEAEIALLLKEKEGRRIKGSLRSVSGIDVAELARFFGGGGHKNAAGFEIKDKNLAEAEEMVIAKLREFQDKRFESQSEVRKIN